ncbi:MAG: metal-dependent hydrolase [Terriglobia bacterium]
MDPVTHTLTGLVLARAGADRLGPYATAAVVAGAVLPDADSLLLLGGAGFYLRHQGAWMHSLLGGAVLGLMVTLAVWLATRNKKKRPRPAGLAAAGLLGVGSHLALDTATLYGPQLLWPFKTAWYSLNWFPTVDPWLLVLLLFGLGLPFLFRLISEEIGAGRSPRLPVGAWITLALVLVLAAGRMSWHDSALRQFESRLYRGRSPRRVEAFPSALSPLRWRGVIETDATYEVVERTLQGTQDEPENVATFYKPEPSSALEAALAAPTAKAFLAWARFPRAALTAFGSGWRVELSDLRDTVEGARWRNYVAVIELGPDLEVESEEVRLAAGDQ